MENYIFIINKLEIGFTKIEQEELIEKLFKEKEWIFLKSNHQKMDKLEKGSNVLLYIAGLGNRYFYGQFKVGNSVEQLKEFKYEFYKFFSRKIDILNVKKWDKKVYMKDIKDELEFIKDKKNYGLYLRQSVKKISAEDYKFILSKQK